MLHCITTESQLASVWFNGDSVNKDSRVNIKFPVRCDTASLILRGGSINPVITLKLL